MVERAPPAQLRNSLEVAHQFAKAGIRFVPMPCADEKEYAERMIESIAKLDEIEQAAASSEGEANAHGN